MGIMGQTGCSRGGSMRIFLKCLLAFTLSYTVGFAITKLVTDVETDPYRDLDYDVPNTYYMEEEEYKPKKCLCTNCSWR